jgi:hypothetical protein
MKNVTGSWMNLACLGAMLILPGIASATCYVSPASALPYSVPASGTTAAVAISAPAGCPWFIDSRGSSWIQILSARNQSGSAVVYYRILPNPSGRARVNSFGPQGVTNTNPGNIGGRSSGGGGTVVVSTGFTINVTQSAR